MVKIKKHNHSNLPLIQIVRMKGHLKPTQDHANHNNLEMTFVAPLHANWERCSLAKARALLQVVV